VFGSEMHKPMWICEMFLDGNLNDGQPLGPQPKIANMDVALLGNSLGGRKVSTTY